MIMKCCADTHDDDNKGCRPEQELIEERFFEQFAALEDGLAVLQLQMRGMSENVKLFGSFLRQVRQSTCPAGCTRHETVA
jgi:hypothetical protein